MKFAIALLAVPLLVAASPSASPAAAPALEKRCYVGPPQTWIMDTALSMCRQRGCSSKATLALFEACTVESNWNNLDCGDQDSLGCLQQRPSQGWGTPSQLQTPSYAIGKFLDILIPADEQTSWYSAGQLAQHVQGSERPDAYDQAQGRAQGFLTATIQRAGGGGGGSGGSVNVESAPGSKSSPAKSTSTGCKQTYKVVRGNTCHAIQAKFGISVAKFLSLNKSVNAGCTNLQIGKSYCVKN